jgi:uncharacterized metal-binding protein YceD (DUF177 family)
MAARFARSYGEERAERKEFGAQQATALPRISHPVFKGKPVNVDSREVFVRQRFEARGCSTTTTVRWCRRCMTIT